MDDDEDKIYSIPQGASLISKNSNVLWLNTQNLDPYDTSNSNTIFLKTQDDAMFEALESFTDGQFGQCEECAENLKHLNVDYCDECITYFNQFSKDLVY